ncbi:DNA topoisomerase I [Candidatus Uhrbacteria bacterium RIFCSPHIGHO2_01_FULL_63_20]|uniref:DNA topoisomerase 1 n=1 Tax=Candidatus Uhrbacteria bacterium RIFCSPHIGHO2_01_FULL_63_20 TaxID=1802385 RepID=A0A1F7TMQ0_9BACT|nr:MAG: DNA topoisomerase I [Candidatus Uhrbacteria bacterium RIFCSPHIGHO2_01_FULL_63_20]
MSKTLVIVESPTKAKTISKFLGKDYKVLSSFGHVRDLPASKTGVDVKHGFAPTYEVPERAKKHVLELKSAAKDAQEVLLATDEDREGEAIAWHIAEILDLDEAKAKRITFHEITKHAIDDALTHPRALDMNLVHAQQMRRILDRLVGYELSPLLWKKVRRGLSAGRVQSVAVRLVVERERERDAFKIDEYWTIDGLFEKDKTAFDGKLSTIDGKKLEKLDIKDEAAAKKIVDDLAGVSFAVSRIEKKQVSKAPPVPFTTSALQIEANAKLGMSAKQTMTLAQKLYETGRITYMRTDSTNLAEKFLGEAQAYLKNTFGDKYATGARTYKTDKKGAQEAHEAIRPTDPSVTPESLKGELDPGEFKLYDLVWRRSLATQMPNAELERTSVDVAAKRYGFRCNGNAVHFDGYMKVYRGAQEKLLPELAVGDAVAEKEVKPVQHFTEPPPRYGDATLVKTMEEFGIGRPSTYAPTISTIVDRGYVERDDNKKLKPTEVASVVTDLLKEHFPDIVDYAFTAKMEKTLDDVAEGQEKWAPALEEFYKPFHERVTEKTGSLKREEVLKEHSLGMDPGSGLEVFVKSGRFGPFVQLGEWKEEDRKAKVNKPKSASLPRDANMDTVTLEAALKALELPRTIGTADDGTAIETNVGRFGPYLKVGKTYVSLPPGFDPRTVSLEDAKRLVSEGLERKRKMMEPLATLGEDPETKGTIQVKDGRYGPYVTDGTTNATIKKGTDPKNVTLPEAIELLKKKRAAPKRNWTRKKKAMDA